MGSIPTIHIPNKKELIEKALNNTDFMIKQNVLMVYIFILVNKLISSTASARPCAPAEKGGMGVAFQKTLL